MPGCRCGRRAAWPTAGAFMPASAARASASSSRAFWLLASSAARAAVTSAAAASTWACRSWRQFSTAALLARPSRPRRHLPPSWRPRPSQTRRRGGQAVDGRLGDLHALGGLGVAPRHAPAAAPASPRCRRPGGWPSAGSRTASPATMQTTKAAVRSRRSAAQAMPPKIEPPATPAATAMRDVAVRRAIAAGRLDRDVRAGGEQERTQEDGNRARGSFLGPELGERLGQRMHGPLHHIGDARHRGARPGP